MDTSECTGYTPKIVDTLQHQRYLHLIVMLWWVLIKLSFTDPIFLFIVS